MTIIKIVGQPKMELRKQPALVVSVHTDNGVFEDEVPLYFSNQHESEDQEVTENKLCDLADEVNGTWSEKFKGLDIKDYESLEKEIRKINNKTIKLATSMACFRASAAESGVPLQQHLRTKYSDKCLRAMALPVTCTGALDGDGDLGCDMGRAQYTVYLCPTGASDPMSAVMMCGQVYRRLGQGIADAHGFDHLKGGDEARLLLPEVSAVDRSLPPVLAMVRQAVQDEGLTKSVRLGVWVQKDSADIDICGELLSQHDLVFAGAGDRLVLAGGEGAKPATARIYDMWEASTVGEMSDICAAAEHDTPLCLRQRLTHTTAEHLEFMMTVAAAMGSELMLTGAPSKRHYEKFNGLMRVDCDENDEDSGVTNAPYAGPKYR